MRAPTGKIGNQIDEDVRTSSRSDNISLGRLRTVQNLLDALNDDKEIGMLRSTAKHIRDCLNVSLDQLAIDVLVGLAPRLTTFLEGCPYSENSLRSYGNYANRLLLKAKQLGWVPQHPEVPEIWKPILARIQTSKICGLRQIVYNAISNGKSCNEYADADLDAWGTQKVEQGFTINYVNRRKWKFRQLVVQGGLQRDMPNLSPPSYKRIFQISVERFSEPLRSQFKELQKWKIAERAEGRGYKGRHRAVTAALFERKICYMVGLLAQNGVALSSLDELFSKPTIERFVKLAQEQTKRGGDALIGDLRLAFAAVKRYPPLQDERLPNKFDWMRSVMADIEPQSESAKRRSKERKWVKYPALERIPDLIETGIVAKRNANEWWVAWMRQKQLIIKWLLVLPWRQLNLRKARLVSSNSDHANIFYDEVSELAPIDLPPWAEAALKVNPEVRLWQFLFDEEETKAGREARGVVSGFLVPSLEEFLVKYRPKLVKGVDPGTLFINRSGRPFNDVSFRDLVGEITRRYVRRRVTPHLFRDIFAVAYLRDTRDYLSLSKVLWHKNPKVTIELYGRFFDESAGARVVEEWLELRQQAKKQMQSQICDGTPEEQLRSLRIRLRERVAELDDLKGTISALEAKIRTPAVSERSARRPVKAIA